MSPSSSNGAATAAPRHRRATDAGPDAASPVATLLGRLTALEPSPHQVVSCYLKLEPRDRARGKYLIKLKNRMKALRQAVPRLGLDRASEESVAADLDRVEQFMRSPGNLPPTQGLAIFACGGRGLFETIALPIVHRSRLAVDTTPLVRELASVEEEFGRLVTVVLDRASARFFEVTAFDIRELPGLRADSTRGSRFHGDQSGPGWGEHNYHNRLRTEKQRHYEGIARELFALSRRHPIDGIVLAAAGAEPNAVRPFLHPYVAERVVGATKLNVKEASLAAVHDATLAVRETFERATEREVVSQMREALGTGWAVNGAAETLRALGRGQVRSLLVHHEATAPGFRCDESGRLVLSARDCRGEGDARPVLDVIDDAIEDALRQGVDVNVVYERAACDSIDGLAALLRFR